MSVRFSRAARSDLHAAHDFIAADNPKAARRVIDAILTAIERLKETPRIGRPGRVEGTRELVINRTPYLAIYEIVDDAVVVLRVLHGRQRWP